MPQLSFTVHSHKKNEKRYIMLDDIITWFEKSKQVNESTEIKKFLDTQIQALNQLNK